jgi:hypothetical protein
MFGYTITKIDFECLVIFHAQLQRLISQTLWDLNEWQTMLKSFNLIAYPKQKLNLRPQLRYNWHTTSHQAL